MNEPRAASSTSFPFFCPFPCGGDAQAVNYALSRKSRNHRRNAPLFRISPFSSPPWPPHFTVFRTLRFGSFRRRWAFLAAR